MGRKSRFVPSANFLHDFDPYVVGECGKGFDVGSVAGEHCATGFGQRNHEGINSRAGSSSTSKLGRTTCGSFTYQRIDDA